MTATDHHPYEDRGHLSLKGTGMILSSSSVVYMHILRPKRLARKLSGLFGLVASTIIIATSAPVALSA